MYTCTHAHMPMHTHAHTIVYLPTRILACIHAHTHIQTPFTQIMLIKTSGKVFTAKENVTRAWLLQYRYSRVSLLTIPDLVTRHACALAASCIASTIVSPEVCLAFSLAFRRMRVDTASCRYRFVHLDSYF